MKKILFLCFISTVLLWNCSQIQDWSDPKDAVPPGKISNPEIVDLNGGARITYKLPADKDILGVKAIYSFNEGGEMRSSFSSAFRDTIELYGFSDTKERNVKLICIDKSLNESEPVSVIITPLTPPVELIRQSLKLSTTFGGIYARWKNEMNSDIAISLFVADSTGEMKLDNTHYTNLAEGTYSFRGFDSSERKFQIQIRDRWENYSEPLDTVIKPLFEQEILSRNEFKVPIWQRYGFADKTTQWRGDIVFDHSNAAFAWTYILDDLPSTAWISTNTGNLLSYWVDGIVKNSPQDKDKFPMYFTLDLGSEVSISRHKLWHREGRIYDQGNFKHYEIWATNKTPKQQANFSNKMESLAYWTSWSEVGGTDAWKNDWVKLGDYSCLPPSGALLVSKLTPDDLSFASQGFEGIVSPQLAGEKFRYVRFVLKELWYTSGILQCRDIKFFGAYANK